MKTTSKRPVRCLLAAVLVIGLCLSLCGCQALDDARASRAVWGDKQHTTVVFGGETYRILPENENRDKLADMVRFPHTGTVTEPDVPVLLADWYGEFMCYNQDATLLCLRYGWDDFFYSYEGLGLYCREDMYDTLLQKLTNLQLDHYCLGVFTHDPVDYWTSVESYAMLTDEQLDALNKTLAEANRFDLSDDEDEEYYIAASVSIYRCDADGWFVDSAYEINSKKSYEDETVGYYTLTDLTSGDRYRVPASLWDVMDGIVDQIYHEWWYC